MTVSELINRLLEFDPDMTVQVFADYPEATATDITELWTTDDRIPALVISG